MSMINIFAPKSAPTTDGVLASFLKVFDDLQGVISHHTNEAENQRIAAEQAMAAHQASVAEAQKARDAVNRLGALINGGVQNAG